MAVDMFLKIDGLDGESADDTHGKEIDVLSWDFGVSQSGTLHIATGGGAGKASFSDLLVEKFVDSATTNLFGAVAKGKHFGSAVLTVRKAGDTPLEYLKYEMTEVMITSYKSGAVKEESDERSPRDRCAELREDKAGLQAPEAGRYCRRRDGVYVQHRQEREGMTLQAALVVA